jgi:hypothetical protein
VCILAEIESLKISQNSQQHCKNPEIALEILSISGNLAKIVWIFYDFLTRTSIFPDKNAFLCNTLHCMRNHYTHIVQHEHYAAARRRSRQNPPAAGGDL